MRRLPLLITMLTLLVAVPSAAASSSSVLADWRDDGVINQNYKASDLRSADSQISSQEREYFNWDEQYSAALERATDPTKRDDPPPPPVVKPKDSNGNGKIDPTEKAAAAKENAERREEYEDEVGPIPAGGDDDGPSGGDGPGGDGSDDGSSNTSSKGDDGGVSWPLLGALAVIILVAAVGVWRAVRGEHDEHAEGDADRLVGEDGHKLGWRERRALRREAEGGGGPHA